MAITLKPVSLGQRLRAARQTAGLTQGTVAEYLGVRKHTVAMWEGDHHSPSVEHLLGLSRLLIVPVSELVAGADAEPVAGDEHDRETQSLVRLYRQLSGRQREIVLALVAQLQLATPRGSMVPPPKAIHTPLESESAAA